MLATIIYILVGISGLLAILMQINGSFKIIFLILFIKRYFILIGKYLEELEKADI
jgi:hypothetical protein